MPSFEFEMTGAISEQNEKMIEQGHAADEANAGIVCNYKKYSLIANNKNSQVVGVLSGYTAFAEIYVDDLWVQPSCRKKGLGRKLLEELENRFKDQGFNNINLVTSEFQAPKFYEKCGFDLEFIRENKLNPKLSKYFFLNR